MTPLHVVYYIGIAVGIAMFTASWLIRRNKITTGKLARVEKPLLLGGAIVTFVFAMLGFTSL